MRTMYRLAIVTALTGCYDGRIVGSDASPIDADTRGIVRVKVGGFVEKAGLHVYFQESDSSLSLSTETDANGEVTGRLGPNGFVTLVAGFEPTLTLWTYTGVQPGDELEFFEPDVVDVDTPIDSISIFADNAGAPPFTLRSGCGGAQTIFDPLPVAMPIAICKERVDFLLEQGQVYRFAKDVDLSKRRIDFEGEFEEYALSTVTIGGAPQTGGWVMQSLIGQGAPLASTEARMNIIDGQVRAVLGLPLPASATMLTHIDLDDPGVQHLIDWRPSDPNLALAYNDVSIARATQPPRYDATSTSIVWSEGPGTPGDLVRATLFWLDPEHARTRNWIIVGPRDAEPKLRVPLLPAPDLVPHVEIPQTMESLIVGEHRDWARRHLLGRWLPQGVAWPTNGDAGRVVWRSL